MKKDQLTWQVIAFGILPAIIHYVFFIATEYETGIRVIIFGFVYFAILMGIGMASTNHSPPQNKEEVSICTEYTLAERSIMFVKLHILTGVLYAANYIYSVFKINNPTIY